MKPTTQRTLSSLLIVLLFSFGISLSSFAQEELSETRSLDSFSKLNATNGINVLLRKSSENKVDVRISNGLLSDVITEVKSNTLRVRMRPQINKELSVLVVVFYKSLDEIVVTKGASLETKTVILTDKLEIDAKTGGSVKAEIEASDVKLTASGGGDINLYGWAKRFEVNANTKGSVQAKTLKADRAFVRASTGGEVWVHPKEYLEAVANSGATIFYTNKADKINERVSSGGEVRNKVSKIGNNLIRDVE